MSFVTERQKAAKNFVSCANFPSQPRLVRQKPADSAGDGTRDLLRPQNSMKTFLSWCATVLLSVTAQAQAPQAVTARDIKIDKITPSVTSSPQYNVSNTTDKRATYL